MDDVEATGSPNPAAARRERKRSRDVLLETQRSFRNTLGVIRSVVRRTIATSRTLEKCGQHIEGRIGAIMRAQSALLGDPGLGFDLEFLLAGEFLACHMHQGSRLTLSGPKTRLAANATESLALAFHELATNALKFGAHSGETGHVAVTWQLSGPVLTIAWVESGGAPIPQPPRHRGFGSELLERTLPYALGAEVALRYPRTGFQGSIRLPANVTIGRTGARSGRKKGSGRRAQDSLPISAKG